MSALPPPRTPLRKVLLPGSNHSSRQQTPTSSSSTSKKPIIGASPAVRAAIAALKAQRPPPQSTSTPSNFNFDSTNDDRNAIGGFGGISEGITLDQESLEAKNEWGMRDVQLLIDKARTSGRLNLASRSLQTIPTSTYSALISESSPYHPDNRNKSIPKPRPIAINYEILPVGEVATAPVWFEQTDLITLNVGNNELRVIDDEIGGMEWLENFDLHNNYLHKLPLSICFLQSLTSLNLSSNHLAEFPQQLLSLISLKDLNLSSNLLDGLWSNDWEEELESLLYSIRNPPVSPSASPSTGATATLRGHFGEFSNDTLLEGNSIPFPKLKKLSVGGNRFKKDTFKNDFKFPVSLVELDLSGNGIRERDIDIRLFSGLKDLEVLDLSGNEIGDDWFSEISTGEEIGSLFPSLKSIDLSKNDLEELGQLEMHIETNIGGRKIEWVGLPKIIANLVHASGVLSDINGVTMIVTTPLEVRVIGNPLSREQVRRRATFPSASNGYSATSPSSCSSTTTDSPTLFIGTPSATPIMSRVSTSIPLFPESPTKKRIEKEEWEIQAEAGLATEGGRRKARIEAARREKEEKETFQLLKVAKSKMLVQQEQEQEQEGEEGENSSMAPPSIPKPSLLFVNSPVVPISVSIPEPAPIIVVKVDPTPTDPIALELFNNSTSTADFSKRSISIFPQGGINRIKSPIPTALDLSYNTFSSLQFSNIISWKWSSLKILNLSHNSIVSSDLSLLALSSEGHCLSNLEELDLSYNQLTSTITSSTSSNSETTPLFKLLSSLFPNLISLNLSYNNLTSTIEIGSILASSSFSSFSEGTGKGKGKGIEELNLRGNKILDLDDLCEFSKDFGGGSNSSKFEKINWNCRILDLQDNVIGRLPPVLGLLPGDLEFLVAGNPFRLPRPDVYINGGSKGLLAWLKERV